MITQVLRGTIKGAKSIMISRKLLAGVFVLVLGCLSPMLAQSVTTRPADNDDPNWIGPTSWERRFTIPSFVATPKGMTLKTVTTRPASETASYTTIRHRRTTTDASATGGARPTRATGDRYGGRSERGTRADRGGRGRY
jgi:hypothetical protein